MAEEADALAGDGPLTAREAAGLLSNLPPAEESETEEVSAPAEQEEIPTEKVDDAAPVEAQPDEDHGEPTEEGDPATTDDDIDLPAIDPPKSWTKAEQDAFADLPREHQEAISAREIERERTIARRHTEAAHIRSEAEKAIEQAEHARRNFERRVAEMIPAEQAAFATEFNDITSWEDVQRLAIEDPARHGIFQAKWQALQAKSVQAQQAQQREAQEAQAQYQKYVDAETERFLAEAPEFADPNRAPALQAEVKGMFNDHGVEDEELAAVWSGNTPISVHDHRVQMIIRDAMRYRMATKKAATAAKQTARPVQRPGTAKTKAEAQSARLETLENKLNSTGSIDDAVALLRAGRSSR